MGLFDFLKGKTSRAEFAQIAMARLAEMGWPHAMSYDAADDRLELGGVSGAIGLRDMFQTWLTYPRGERDEALTRAVRFVFELKPPATFEEGAALLRPVVRSRAVIEAMISEASELGEVRSLEGVWRPLATHLAVLVAVDRPYSTMLVDRGILRDWSCTFEEVFAVALANLNREPPLSFEGFDGKFFLATSEDGNALGRLALAEPFKSLGLKGAPVVVAILRSHLVVAGDDDPQALEDMADFVGGFLEQERAPVCYAPIVWRDEAWRSYEPPGHGSMRWLHHAQQSSDYDQQIPFVLRRLDRQNRHDVIAELHLLPFENEGGSITIWKAEKSLLPKADLLLIRRQRKPNLVRAWDDVAAACGFESEPDAALPYYHADWPDAATMAKIEAAPEPEWAKGKAVSFVDGRLSIFG